MADVSKVPELQQNQFVGYSVGHLKIKQTSREIFIDWLMVCLTAAIGNPKPFVS